MLPLTRVLSDLGGNMVRIRLDYNVMADLHNSPDLIVSLMSRVLSGPGGNTVRMRMEYNVMTDLSFSQDLIVSLIPPLCGQV